MKLIAATLIAGGTLVGAEMPSPGYDECAIVSVDVAAGEPTFIDPEPGATSMRLIAYCGQRVTNSSGSGTHNEPALKFIDVDLEQAEVIVQAAEDLLDDGEVYLP